MNILALETSTEACSVAILNSQSAIFSEFSMTPRKHTQYLLVMMDSVLAKAHCQKSDITHIAYASGPGAFTGVRIAASTAQGLSIGLNIPLVAISTLATLAQQTADSHNVDKIIATLDARMGEAYVGKYLRNSQTGLVELEGEEQLVKLDKLTGQQEYFLSGSGFKAGREAGFGPYSGSIDEDALPSAAALVKLAQQSIQRKQAVPADQATINYIRNKVAEKKKVHVL